MALTNGKLKSIFALKVGSTDYVGDIISFETSSDEADSDTTTFGEYNAGLNFEEKLKVTAAWDGGSASSLHSYLWTNAGSTAAVEIQTRTGAVSASNPKYTGQLRIPRKPDLKAEAGKDATFEFEFEIVGTLTKVIAP